MKYLPIVVLSLLAVACENEQQPAQSEPENTDAAPAAEQTSSQDNSLDNSLTAILERQDEDAKARYQYRNPKQTLEFFQIEPGMTVIEILPGGGWYSKILVPYLGENGTLIGVNYDRELWQNFPFANDEFMQQIDQWPKQWEQDAQQWGQGRGAAGHAYTVSTISEDHQGKVDAVLFIRAMHNLARFNGEPDRHLDRALTMTYDMLKPGGLVGIVQHQAPEDKSDEWADGSRGYLKKSNLVETMENYGFELIGESEINENPKDQPGDDDLVWRLPPFYYTSQDNEELRQQYAEIGESNRMTLLFKKPETGE